MDESIYYGYDFVKKTAWSLQKKNISLNQITSYQKKVSMMAGISSVNSDVKYISKIGQFFTASDFIEFIKKI